MMKNALRFAAALLLLSACKAKTESPEAPASPEVVAPAAAPSGPIADNEISTEEKATLGGHVYTITLERRVATERPTVADWEGDEYYDNICEVTVDRDGATWVRRVFTLDDFRPYLKKDELKGARLLGMAYDAERSDAGRLMFGAQTGQAGMEGCPAFCVALATADGSVSIAPDMLQDIAGGEMGD